MMILRWMVDQRGLLLAVMMATLVAAAGLLAGCGSGSGTPEVVISTTTNTDNENTNDNTNPGNTSGGGQPGGGGNPGDGGGGDGQTARGRLQVDLIVLAPPVSGINPARQDGATTTVVPMYRVTVNAHLRDTAENLVEGATVMAGELNSFFADEHPFVGVWDVRVDVKTNTDPAILIESSTPAPITVVAGQLSRLPLTIALAASP